MIFTQFLRPHGRQTPTEITRSPEIEALAKRIQAAGYRFEIEVLMTDQVSMEIVKDVPDPDMDDSLAIEICHNGPEHHGLPGVPESVDRMVRDAAKVLGL